jgi:hypothetical protein
MDLIVRLQGQNLQVMEGEFTDQRFDCIFVIYKKYLDVE